MSATNPSHFKTQVDPEFQNLTFQEYVGRGICDLATIIQFNKSLKIQKALYVYLH